MKKCPSWMVLMGILTLLFGCSSEANYQKKGGKWHYEDTPINRETEPVDFKPLGDYFAKDDRVGYYRGIPIYDGNDASHGPSFEAMNRHYAKDKSRVYYCDTERDSREYWSIKRNRIKRLGTADPASFRLLGDGYLARDKLHLFHKDQVVPVRDIDSYQLLEYGFAKDKVRGYYSLAEVAGSDGGSFEALDSHYAKDRSKIYYVDGVRVGGAIKGVHLESFTVAGDGYATDGNKAYYRGVVIATENASTLQNLSGMGYAKTLRQVFHNGKLIRDADAPSFSLVEKFNDKFDATDKSGQFRSGERVK